MQARPSPAAAAGVGVGLVVIAGALIAGRADVALVGVVLIVAVAASGLTRMRGMPTSVTLTRLPLERDGDLAVAPVRVEVAAEGAQLVPLRLTASSVDVHWLTAAGPTADIVVRVPVAHSGRQTLLAVTAGAAGPDALTVTGTGPDVQVAMTLDPPVLRMRGIPVPPRPTGLTGAHQSLRPGDGGEFRDIHPFTPGDRLRRVDWKATARLGRSPGDLYVRRTFATSDIDVALVLDDTDDVGADVSDWALQDPTLVGARSLDVAREAAWSLASAYLDASDQVSFQVLSRPRSQVPRGSGARHRERLRASIATASAHARQDRRVRAPLVPAGALVVLLSPFLDDDVARLATLWRAAGHTTLAVDTLPAPRLGGLTREQRVAARIVLGEHDDRLHAVRASGVDVLVWAGAGGDEERAAALRALVRPRRRS
ncbi:hypothetical protein ASD65_00900 [Microbacterium sp. Root61]|uniref:DUF58 domain-containing protein n=1 Tax=Microbacterium sp. Root61 TaxID=1736570 RepID=UPI0006F733B3|nr:DUF58 domain-containing protein [Microbacterium sp. Root61]KRA23134.1 hypothetical protein ASD65_00900 [Microbacterium sp. Root61]